MNNKSGWLIIVLAILLSLSLLRRSQNSQPPITPMVQTSIDDDPMMGAINAPVTIIEFSDYECPYCKRFANDTLPQLKSMYIDMGKVRLIYRPLPMRPGPPTAPEPKKEMLLIFAFMTGYSAPPNQEEAD